MRECYPDADDSWYREDADELVRFWDGRGLPGDSGPGDDRGPV